jgi:hydrocephalus-inducing protein
MLFVAQEQVVEPVTQECCFLDFIQEIIIDIVGREPKDNPGGISYRLIAEACIPSINVDDLGSIFEEHRICKSLSIGGVGLDVDVSTDMSLRLNDQLCGGIFGEEDRKFVFSNALVGVKSKARFKITNIKKV